MPENAFLPLHDCRQVVVAGADRWVGQMYLPGSAEPTAMLVLEHEGHLVSFPRLCPHQGGDLLEAEVGANGMLVCPHHGRNYPLACDKHFSLVAERRGTDLVVLLPSDQEGGTPSLSREISDNLALENARLQQELAALRAANHSLEERIGSSMQTMDTMLREVEARKNKFERTSRRFESLAELVTRITDSIHDIMLVTDVAGRVIRASRSALTCFGVPLEHLVGVDIDTLLNPSDLDRLRPRLQGTWATRPLIYELIYADETFEEEVELRPLTAPDVSAPVVGVCHLLHGSILYDSYGKEEGLILLASNISSVKQREQLAREQELEAHLENLRDALGNIGQGVALRDANLALVICNNSFLKLLGYPESFGRSGTSFESFVRHNAALGEYGPGDVEELVLARLTQAHTFQSYLYERELPDGRIIEFAGKPLEKGGFISTYTDITERKRHEIALQEFNTTLEQRIAERTEALQQALLDLGKVVDNLEKTQDDLVRSEKLAALGAMVAGVAHELNTPIGNSLLVASHIVARNEAMLAAMKTGLKRSMLDEFFAGNGDSGDLLMRNLTKASELVSSFKQVAVDQTSSQRRHFDLATMVAEVVTMLGPTIRKTPYLVETRIPAGLVMDSYPGPLGQVLTNLITNAILHGFEERPHGKVIIEGRKSESDNQIEITVTDDGKGIAPDVLPRIFDPFFTTKLGQGGSGLGLNIAHNMMSGILTGRINVASEVGKGTCFTLVLAMTAPDRRALAVAAEGAQASAS